MSQAFDSFVLWESSTRDTIDLKKIYVDMAGDLIAGVMISQIVYWHLPSKEDGKTRLRVERDGHMWVAKTRDEWWDECRIKPRQADRALKILEDAELIECETYQFGGSPTKHVRIRKDGFMRAFQTALRANPKPGVRSNGSGNSISPNGDIHITDRGKPYTESTAESTTSSPRGVPSTPKEWLELMIDRAREVGFEATPRQHNTWVNELGSKKRREQDPQELLSLIARVLVKASEGHFCSLKKAEEGPAGKRAVATARGQDDTPIKGEEGHQRRTKGYEDLFDKQGSKTPLPEPQEPERNTAREAPDAILLSLVPDDQREGLVGSEVSKILQRRIYDLARGGGSSFETAREELRRSPWLSEEFKETVIRNAEGIALDAELAGGGEAQSA